MLQNELGALCFGVPKGKIVASCVLRREGVYTSGGRMSSAFAAQARYSEGAAKIAAYFRCEGVRQIEVLSVLLVSIVLLLKPSGRHCSGLRREPVCLTD